MKKKIIVLLLVLIITTACKNTINTPVNKIQGFLGKYQRLDENVLKDLDLIISKKYKVSNKIKKEYKKIFEKQYQTLSYKIKDEETDEEESIIIVELEVLDYKMTIDKAKKYYMQHSDKLDKEYENYNKYIINELNKTTDKTNYEIIFHLEYKDNNWKILPLEEDDILKLHGLY